MTERILGLDYGEKHIGVAFSDKNQTIAQPYTVINTDSDDVFSVLTKIIEEKNIKIAVVGDPLNMDGSAGPSAESAREFASRLDKKTDVETVMWDERMTSISAERTLLEGDISRQKRKDVIDKVAASMILKSYLNSRGKQEQ